MAEGIAWEDFKYKGKVYELGHLHPQTIVYTKPEKDGKQAVTYQVNVQYSQHCFTREPENGETPAEALLHKDGNEIRVFDFDRWDISHTLPKTIECLIGRRCLHASERNFAVIDPETHYAIFFRVFKSSQKSFLDMLVQSAYVKNDIEGIKHQGSIKFEFILHNVKNGIPIKPPK